MLTSQNSSEQIFLHQDSPAIPLWVAAMFHRRIGAVSSPAIPPTLNPLTVCLPRLLSAQTARFPQHLINKEKFAFGANCRENQFAGNGTFNKMQFYNCLRGSGDSHNYLPLVFRDGEIKRGKNHNCEVCLHIQRRL